MNKEYLYQYLQVNGDRKIVLDSSDVPFLKPAGEYSDLSESISVSEKFKTNYPAIAFNKACLVDGAVLVQDIAPDFALTQTAKRLNEVSSITLQVVDGLSLTNDMVTLVKKSGILDDNPLAIYPGNGSQVVRNYLSLTDKRFIRNSISLPTQRTMIKNGKFDLAVDYSSIPQKISTNTVLIIDDVVASGQTTQTIANEIKTRFPSIKCVLAAWLFLMPTKPENKKSPSGIMGIYQTLASIVLKGNLTSRPPINSLSCFRRNENQYEEMKANFLNKYITDPKTFIEFVNKL